MRNGIVGALLSFGLATSAQATVFFAPGGGENLDLTNVLFGSNETAAINTPLLADFAGGAPNSVQFVSDKNALIAPSNGAARLEAQDGNLQQLTISSPTVGAGFDTVQFNLNAVNNVVGQEVTFTVNDQLDATPARVITAVLGNGENRFTFTTDALQFITSLAISTSSLVGLEDVRQLRFAVAAPSEVPLPAALPIFVSVMAGGLIWSSRRRHAHGAVTGRLG